MNVDDDFDALDGLAPLPREGNALAGTAIPTELRLRAKELERAGFSANTLRAYASCWQQFELWCREMKVVAIPATPETLVAFVADCEAHGRTPATVDSYFSAIRHVHLRAGLESPTKMESVVRVIRGYHREAGVDRRRALPLSPDQLRAMVRAMPGATGLELRDRALLLLGFFLALRRSEIVALNLEDIAFEVDGTVNIRIGGGIDDAGKPRKTKTDQEGKGVTLRLEPGTHADVCPVVAVRNWVAALELGNVTTGPLFVPLTRDSNLRDGRLSGDGISDIIRKAMKRAGIESAGYSGHSLRAGFVTAAKKAGFHYEDIVKTTRHRSLETVRIYDRDPENPKSDITKRLDF